ncbi:hypothetical protein [Thauera sp.]|uniref:hypothetical protein n=1 Tax=Thauera sp. TaxID=1905334 RepID=UPI002C314B42|nr:hypothetical protein [Thauera sp.]HRP26378.1 hypothetical protein [Thauera sp.]
MNDDTHEALARAICRETCAYRGEPPCFLVEDGDGKPLPWPNPDCDEPGCHALAAAAVLAINDRSGNVALTAVLAERDAAGDGFGLTGASVAPVPLPAAGWLLLASAAAFLALRRRA